MRPTLSRSATKICGDAVSTRSLATVALELAGGAGGGSISVLKNSSNGKYDEVVMESMSVQDVHTPASASEEDCEAASLRGGNATVATAIAPASKVSVESTWMEAPLRLGEKTTRQEKRIQRQKRNQELKSHKKYAKKLKVGHQILSDSFLLFYSFFQMWHLY